MIAEKLNSLLLTDGRARSDLGPMIGHSYNNVAGSIFNICCPELPCQQPFSTHLIWHWYECHLADVELECLSALTLGEFGYAT